LHTLLSATTSMSRRLKLWLSSQENKAASSLPIEQIGRQQPQYQDYRVKITEFKDKEARLKEVEDLLYKMNEEQASLKQRRHEEFMGGFSIISKKIKEMID
jgi:chromosome segregation ATPase